MGDAGRGGGLELEREREREKVRSRRCKGWWWANVLLVECTGNACWFDL